MAGLATTFGSGAMTNSINEIADAKAILAIGTNTTQAHPVIGLRVKRAVRDGAVLIVANPKRIDLCRFADVFLQHKPGTDVALLMGMMRVILDEGLAAEEYIAERTEDFNLLEASLKQFTLQEAADITGVDAELIAKAARLYASIKPASILYTMGITQHTHGTDNVIAVADLAMITGNVGVYAGGRQSAPWAKQRAGRLRHGSASQRLPRIPGGHRSCNDRKVSGRLGRRGIQRQSRIDSHGNRQRGIGRQGQGYLDPG